VISRVCARQGDCTCSSRLERPEEIAVHDTIRIPVQKPRTTGTVLLIEDEEILARGLTRLMKLEGYDVVHAATPGDAIEKVMAGSFDVVISDLHLPGASGVDVLNVVRAYDPDVPVVLLTGSPTMETAIEAVSLGVLEYLVKPASAEQLSRVLARATASRKEGLMRREVGASSARPRAREEGVAPPARPTLPSVGIRTTFDRALASLRVTLEPVVDPRDKSVAGFAARIGSDEPALESEAALVVAADRLGCLQDLRRRARDLAVKAYSSEAPPGALLFVDVHQSDLLDGDLYSSDPPLARIADRVVLQVRGRGIAIAMEDLAARASVLRFLGFRLAITDLDEGQACLTQIAELSPEFVKIDQRLVRGVDRSPARQRIVAALASMCKALDARAVAEGVASAEERDALVLSGCDFVQGPLVAHHAPASAPRRVVLDRAS
jgi:EAL domain-containing protein (putative c-di-GMP-specific phosphodiesterase class I)